MNLNQTIPGLLSQSPQGPSQTPNSTSLTPSYIPSTIMPSPKAVKTIVSNTPNTATLSSAPLYTSETSSLTTDPSAAGSGFPMVAVVCVIAAGKRHLNEFKYARSEEPTLLPFNDSCGTFACHAPLHLHKATNEKVTTTSSGGLPSQHERK